MSDSMRYGLLVALWLIAFGPFWLLGWGVLHATKHLNRLASWWCHFLMMVFP